MGDKPRRAEDVLAGGSPEDSGIYSRASLAREFKAELVALDASQRQYREQQDELESQRRRKRDADRDLREGQRIEADHAAHLAEKRASAFKTLAAAGLAVAAAVGGVFTWAADRIQASADKARDEIRHREETDDRVGGVERGVEANTAKIDKLGEFAIDLQIQDADGTAYVIDRIDEAHPRSADRLEEPPAVKAARKKATRAKAEKRLGRSDPFGEK